MGSALGLTTVLGHGAETTWGTAVTPDKFLEINSEGLEEKKEVVQSSSLRGGAVHARRGSRRVVTARWGEGPIELEVVKNGMGRLVNHALGGTSTIVQQAATAAYLQTHSLGSTLGMGLTIQKQLRDESNTVVQKFTMAGTKITSVEFTVDKKGMLMLSLSCDSKTFETTTAAASPSYTTTSTWHFGQAACRIGGVAASLVSGASVKFDRMVDTDRFHFGGAGRKSEQLLNDFPEISGSLTAEFADPAAIVDKFSADSAHEFVLEFVGDIIASTYAQTFRITIPEIRFLGETPKVGGAGLVTVNHPFQGQYDGTNPDIKVEIISTDTTIS